MKDPALQALLQELITLATPILLVADENMLAVTLPVFDPSAIDILTNRQDVANGFLKAGFNVHLNDFDFDVFTPQSFQSICYRISKEKALVHHIINHSPELLKPQGQLLLAGLKSEGIKTYCKKTQQWFASDMQSNRVSPPTGQISYISKPTATPDVAAKLDDKDYQRLRIINSSADQQSTVELQLPEFYSKPGVFGWDKIDQGSQFLIDVLNKNAAIFSKPAKSMLDLGCGYGFLTVMTAQFDFQRIVATDNSATALLACHKNFEVHNIKAELCIDDCAARLNEPFDLILCNPPFHQGFKTDSSLTTKFLNSSHRLLAKKGRALFVVNQFIPLEREAGKLFSSVERLGDNGQFKVIMLKI